MRKSLRVLLKHLLKMEQYLTVHPLCVLFLIRELPFQRLPTVTS